MVKWLGRAGMIVGAGLGLTIAGVLLCALPAMGAQTNAYFGPASSRSETSKGTKQRPLPDRPPEKPSLPPEFSIPVGPLGFSAPATSYLGLRWCFVSLDFLDENRLLFTFRVPGLIHRDPGESEGSEERQDPRRGGGHCLMARSSPRHCGPSTTGRATCGRSGMVTFYCAIGMDSQKAIGSWN